SAGQGSYAAANAFLDGLAAARRSVGLPAVSLAWGLWEQRSGMTGHLAGRDTDRLARIGMRPLSTTQALSLFDAATDLDEPLAVLTALDPSALAVADRPLLAGIARRPVHRDVSSGRGAQSVGGLAAQLAGLPSAGQEALLVDLVRAQAAAVLGHASPEAIGPGRPFRDLGFDSLTAVELRNRLATATGLRLPATAVFDYPAPAVLGRHLQAELAGEPDATPQVMPVAGVADEPVAIVGMGCRFPGGVGDPEELWGLLAAGGDAIGPFPDDRGWDLDGLYDSDPDHLGTSYVRAGGFVRDAAEFDAGFFGISPREAVGMDPQQRLLLEVCWEALERAGIDPDSLRGTPAGVFAGAAGYGYGAGSVGGAEGYGVTGGSGSVISGRVSYVLGLEGPAMTVDTACSSSLVAMHLAAQALRAGECDLALAGGVTVMSAPAGLVEFSRQRALAADGRCKAFGADADGMGMSEGAGMLVLMRLSDAQRGGHRVLAVIRGSAVNHDGASNGLTAPNGPSQQRVIMSALASAGLTPTDVDAVEAHGTGTALGDPIEAQALIATYGQGREDRPLWLGSVKSNIGHTQAAAGVAGVMKMVLSMRHEVLPETLHAGEPSPHIDWSAGDVRLLSEPVPWPTGDGRPRRAGVSSFGISGTNAHVILEEAPAVEEAVDPDPGQVLAAGGPVAWLVSGRDVAGLAGQAGRLREFVAGRPELDPVDVGYSLATTRAALDHRAVVVGSGRRELLAGLASVAVGQPGAGVVSGTATGGGRSVLVFPGQGSQWAGMGVELARVSPVFAARLAECSQVLEPLTGWRLEDVLADGELLQRVEVVQPALWAVMVSLAAVWEAAGVLPDAVAGHSQGEIAAAVVAGVLSLEDAARVVALRARALAHLDGSGAMVAVAEPADRVRERLSVWGGRLSVAVVNSPSAVVVSGDRVAALELLAGCEAEGVRARLLPVGYASHGRQVDVLEREILGALESVRPGRARLPMVSAMTGEILHGPELDARYWFDSLRAPVDFRRSTRVLAERGYRMFIEASPHPVLTAAISETLEDVGIHDALVTGTLTRDAGGAAGLLTALGRAYAAGTPVDWELVAGSGRRVDLPTYAFQRARYWLQETPKTGDVTSAGLGTAGHPLLGAAVELASGDGLVLTGRLSLATQPWLADHVLLGRVVVPGAALAEMAAAAGEHAGCGRVEELVLQAPLVIPPDEAVQVQVRVGVPDAAGIRSIAVHARSDSGAAQWSEHASGTLSPPVPAGDRGNEGPAEGGWDERQWPPAGAAAVDISEAYEELAGRGYEYGPAFRGLHAVWRREEETYAEVRLPEEVQGEAELFRVHPVLLDAVLHAVGPGGLLAAADGPTLIPFAWRGVTLHAAGATAVRARLWRSSTDELRLQAVDAAGRPVLTVDSLVLRPVTVDQLGTAPERDALFTVRWIPSQEDMAREEPVEVAVAGASEQDLAAALGAVSAYPDLDAVSAAVSDGPPHVVLARVVGEPGGARAAGQALALVQQWLQADPSQASVLAVVTEGAVSTESGEVVTDLGAASVWGLVRSAQAENPGRFALVDLDPVGLDVVALRAALAVVAAGEPEVAVRGDRVLVRRLARPVDGELLEAPAGPWRLRAEGGTVDGLVLAAAPGAAAELGAGQVRVAVRASGVNFRDVLVALGMYPGGGDIGVECAGVVTEVGPQVSGLALGDRVMGLVTAGFGPVVVADHRLLVRVPSGWSWPQAGSTPVAFLTAYYALVVLAGVRRGERLLVHAAAGGVGMAAVQLAQHLGAQVYATAIPAKWPVLTSMGLDHMSSSRSTEFEEEFLTATRGAGMDVVLNALAGELTDASLRLLPRGGRFVEMGKTDVRDPGEIAARYPGVTYRAFDLAEAGPEEIQRMFAVLVDLFERGVLEPLPVRAWDVRRAREAFRFMSQARHTGKVVLTVPHDEPSSTVLVTGGTGALGAEVARHLAATGRAGRLLLVSRRGPAASGAVGLAAGLAAAGVAVTVTACDVADRGELAAVISGVPLTGVVHAAGVLDDGVVTALTPERVEVVAGPKSVAAWHLHELTAGLDLGSFVLFSSVAASFGSAGQGGYAAANAFLDGLAAARRSVGLPGVSLAWGLWEKRSGMTGHLAGRDTDRLARIGMRPLSTTQALSLFDAATGLDEPLAVLTSLDPRALTAGGPPLLAGVARRPARRDAAVNPGEDVGEALRRRLAGMRPADQERLLLDLVRAQAAAVLGHTTPDVVEPGRPFRDLGFDSLTAVELRNRLATATGLRLPATAVFDHPTPAALGRHLRTETLDSETPPASALSVLDEFGKMVSGASLRNTERSMIVARLEVMLREIRDGGDSGEASDDAQVKTLTNDEIFDLIDKEIGTL
ncbi:SDR family NAD(P)-dependent oxidoreductase, partial [Actinoplanes sp. NPDC049265]|uniref:SDR family NAD(P)-dependent oxidoreductase n=1 Tax=Actinoplanes sp. NPDC049265 TaxID=3363902 RepID=UPI00371B952A